MNLTRESWTERLVLALLHAALMLTEHLRHGSERGVNALDVLAGQLSWALITRLDVQIGTSPTGRPTPDRGRATRGTPRTGARETPTHTPTQGREPMVITIQPEAVRTTYHYKET